MDADGIIEGRGCFLGRAVEHHPRRNLEMGNDLSQFHPAPIGQVHLGDQGLGWLLLQFPQGLIGGLEELDRHVVAHLL